MADMKHVKSKQRVADHGEVFTPAWLGEAMLALVLIDQALRHRAQCADVSSNTPPIPGRVAG